VRAVKRRDAAANEGSIKKKVVAAFDRAIFLVLRKMSMSMLGADKFASLDSRKKGASGTLQ
jgi:hypothetical protein